MMLIFRPWVRFVGQSADTLSLLVHRVERHLRLREDIQFNYEILSEGIGEEKLTSPVLQFLKENNLVEEVDRGAQAQLDPRVSFLSSIAGGQAEIGKANERLSNAACALLDLSKIGNANFSVLAKLIPQQYFSDLEAFKNEIKRLPTKLMTIVVVDSYLENSLADLNHFMIQENKNWILVNSNQEGIHLGPFFDNNPTHFCFNCFQQRILSWEEKKLRGLSSNAKFYNNADLAKQAELTWLQLQLVRGFAMDFEVLKCFIQFFDVVGSKLVHFPFLPYPLCSVCKP